MLIENRILFVEGIDDLHTISAICKQLEVEENFRIIVPDGEGKIPKRNAQQNQLGGIDNVLKAAKLNLTVGSSAIESLGIVIDADGDLNSRWQAISSILEKAGYKNLPVLTDSKGTIVKQGFLPTFGIWIMPDNQIRGMLEDFLEFLVPDKDKNEVWTKATKCSQEILDEIEEEKRFSEIHLSKAKIHAYLAWQDEPGKPFGTAITAKYLEADNPHCKKFVEWLNRLFIEK